MVDNEASAREKKAARWRSIAMRDHGRNEDRGDVDSLLARPARSAQLLHLRSSLLRLASPSRKSIITFNHQLRLSSRRPLHPHPPRLPVLSGLSGQNDARRRHEGAVCCHKDFSSPTITCFQISSLYLLIAIITSYSFLRTSKHKMLLSARWSVERRSTGSNNGLVEELR